MTVRSVDVRSRDEQAGFVRPMGVTIRDGYPPAGFQSAFGVYASTRDAYDRTNAMGAVGQRSAPGTSSGYAGWYVALPADGTDGLLVCDRLRSDGQRFHSRRLALRALRDLYAGTSSRVSDTHPARVTLRLVDGHTVPGTGPSTVPGTVPPSPVTGTAPDPREVTCGTCYERFVPGDTPSTRPVIFGRRALCPTCARTYLTHVQGYHAYQIGDGPMFGDTDTDVDTFGWELEVENIEQRVSNDTCVERVYRTQEHGVLYAERDGSLSRGWESITAPMTRDYYRDGFDVSAYLEAFRSSGFESHNPGSCGLHVHIGLRAFGEVESERSGALLRFVFLVERYWSDIAKLSRRAHFGSYCRPIHDHTGRDATTTEGLLALEGVTKDDGAGAKRHHLRMYAINMTNEHTVEFRVGRGTLNEASFRAHIDLTWALVDAARDTSLRTLRAPDRTLRDALSKYLTPDLERYMNARGVQ